MKKNIPLYTAVIAASFLTALAHAENNACRLSFLDQTKSQSKLEKMDDRVALAKERLGAQTKKAISVSKGDLVYYEYVPGDADKKPIVVFGGLYYELRNYEMYKYQMAVQGYPLILVSRRTQPESLLSYKKKGHQPSFLSTFQRPSLDAFVEDHKAVLQDLGIDKVDIVTLSYGSSVGSQFALKYPQMYDQITFIAPLVYSMDHRPEEFKIQMQMENLARLNPFTAPFVISGLHEILAQKGSHMIADGLTPEDGTSGGQVPKEWLLAGLQADMRAAEYGAYDLRKIDFSRLKNKKLLLAGQDDPDLLKVQSELVQQALANENNKDFNVVFFEGAAHALTASATVHLALLQDLMTKNEVPGKNVFYIDASTQKFNLVPLSDFLKTQLFKEIAEGKLETTPSVLEPILEAKDYQANMQKVALMVQDLQAALQAQGPFKEGDFSKDGINPLRPYENLKNYKLSEKDRATALHLAQQLQAKFDALEKKLDQALKLAEEFKAQNK